MNRKKLIDEAALNLFRQEFIIPGPEREKAWLNLGIHYVAKIEAALAALEAAGVRLVPVNATLEMTDKGFLGGLAALGTPAQDTYNGIFRAMLAASPYAPQKDESHE